MKIVKLPIFLFGALLALSTHAQVFDVPYKEDAPTRTLLVPAKQPKAVVLLFIGGAGWLKLQDDGSTSSTHTFIRSKNLWAQYGVDAVLVDTPYSLGTRRDDVRPGRDHQERILNVVNFYKEKLKLPVWIFGHSRGTISVSEFVNGEEDRAKLVAGVIIAGTINTVSIDSNVKSPVLGIHHKQDGCYITPYSASVDIIKARSGLSNAKLVTLDGGIDEGDPCQNKAYHGFNQLEPDLIKAAAEFILSH